MIDRYQWRGGSEAMLRFGPDSGPVVVALLPLFEEANRTRALMVGVLRGLSRHGVSAAVPDLPGQGESLVALETVTLSDMRSAHQSLVETFGSRPVVSVAVRSGALIECGRGLAGRWRLAPQDGPSLLRELKRVWQTGGEATPWAVEPGQLVEIAGNRIGSALLAELEAPTSLVSDAPVRTVRLETDAQPADRKLPGRPLWRSAEPDHDLFLAETLAADIADWTRRCAN